MVLRKARDLSKWGLRVVAPRWPGWRRSLLDLADAVLPNSEAEARQVFNVLSRTMVEVRLVADVPNLAGLTLTTLFGLKFIVWYVHNWAQLQQIDADQAANFQ